MFTKQDAVYDQFLDWLEMDYSEYSAKALDEQWKYYNEYVLPGIGCDVEEWEEE